MKRSNKNQQHLPLYGIGPILCFPMLAVTIIGIILSVKRIIPGQLTNSKLNCVLMVIGILLIIEGIILYFCADIGSNLQDDIRSNNLKTSGSY